MLKFVFINVAKLIFLDLKNKKNVLYVILEDIYDGDVYTRLLIRAAYSSSNLTSLKGVSDACGDSE